MSIRSFSRTLPWLVLLSACSTSSKGTVAAQGSAANALAADTVVASFGDTKITLAELDASLGPQLFEMRREALDDMVVRRIVDEQAKAQGKDAKALLDEVASGATAQPTDAQLKALYDKHRDSLGGRSFDEVRPMLVAHESQQARQQVVSAYIDGLKTKAGVHILLPEPRVEVAAMGPAKGPEAAPVTIVTFSDFQCPYCSRAIPTVDRVVKEYDGKVRLVFRNFPLSFHDKAGKAAEAALCANEQGKFWQMHDQMFAHQDQLDVSALTQAATTLGLDGAKLGSCLESGKYAADVQRDIEAGKKAGVSGTPAFFINGRMISGAQPYERFKEIIDAELKGG